MKTDNGKIFRAFAILAAFVAAALMLSGFVYWAAGFAGVGALMLLGSFAELAALPGKDKSAPSGKDESR